MLKSDTDSVYYLSRTLPVVAFTSGKGGCGKTTIAINFGNIISQASNKVLLIDLDINNRGTTGVFSQFTKDAHECLTVTRLLRGEHTFGSKIRNLIKAKEGLYILPATSPDEEAWLEPKDISLAEFVDQFQRKLSWLFEQFGFKCIILDCFCGVDLLTTAGVGAASHSIIINEPDIVTFTGSINLLNHFESSFKDLHKKPKLHFVINRIKSNMSVSQLTIRYRNNLEKAVNEIILCHFPYHERIFKNFGVYPFISDLIPGSLFVRKLELLTYLLFKDEFDHLIKPKVQRWPKRKIQSVYKRSLDSTAVEADYLVLKLTNFPLMAGIWLLVSLTLLRAVPLSPIQAWVGLLVVIAGASYILFSSILHGFWLAARLNYTHAKFRYLLFKRLDIFLEKTKCITHTVTASISGFFVTITVAIMSFYLVTLLFYFLVYMFNINLFNHADDNLRTRIVKVAASTPVRVLNLADTDISRLDFRFHQLEMIRSHRPVSHFLSFDKPLLFAKNTRFLSCRFTDEIFTKSTWNNCVFDRCLFTAINDSTSEAGQYESIKRSDLHIRETDWKGVKFSCTSAHKVIFFERSEFADVKLKVVGGSGICFDDCRINNVVLDDSTDPKSVMLTFRNKRDDQEILFPAEWKAVSFEAFYPRSNDLNRRIAAQEEQLGKKLKEGGQTTEEYFENLSDLIELYLLSNQPEYLDVAKTRLDELLRLRICLENDHLKGVAYLLCLLFDIIASMNHEDFTYDFQNWRSWLERNGYLSEWSWDLWNEFLPRWQLTPEQIKLLDEIQLSAKIPFQL